jgi:hypothetical protein
VWPGLPPATRSRQGAGSSRARSPARAGLRAGAGPRTRGEPRSTGPLGPASRTSDYPITARARPCRSNAPSARPRLDRTRRETAPASRTIRQPRTAATRFPTPGDRRPARAAHKPTPECCASARRHAARARRARAAPRGDGADSGRATPRARAPRCAPRSRRFRSGARATARPYLLCYRAH